MTVRHPLAACAALLVLLLGAGCGERDPAQLTAETDDPYYVQGATLKKQGRNPEALTSFLKVIDRRGERGAAESHLEAGQIYLNHTKDPVYAYYHFRRYLELQPNSRQSELVRGMVKAATREFMRQLPGQPVNEQSVRLQADEENSKLRREVEELRAELAVLRGGGGMPVNRSPKMITVPVEPRSAPVPVPSATIITSPITSAPPRAAPPDGFAVQPAPGSTAKAPAVGTPAARAAAGAAARPPPGGRTHTVAPKETLFSLARRYGVKMEDIAAANNLGSINTPLKVGAVLRIPPKP